MGWLLQNHIYVQKGNMFIAKINFPLGGFIDTEKKTKTFQMMKTVYCK